MKHLRWLLLMMALVSPMIGKSAPERMNVLFLIVDDLNTMMLGDTNRYAGKVIAPNIRRLADSGVLFNHAYAAAPVCSPSRTAVFSGVRPWKSGIYHNGLKMEDSEALAKATSLLALFNQAGYYTASYGKVTHGWEQKEFVDDYQSFGRDPYPPNAPFTSVGRGEQDWGVVHLAEEEMNDTKAANEAIKQLRKTHDRPFLVACGLFHPHMPWYVPQKYLDMYPLDEITTPELLENDLDDVPPLGRDLTSNKAKFVKQVLEAGLHKEAVQAYLASTTYSDTQMGRVLDALEESSYRDNTITILMSDNGFHLGEKGTWQKATLWEEATHILMMFRVPGVTQAGGLCERFVSLQDIYPTLTELCGVERPDYVDGRPLTPLLKNPSAEWASTAITSLADKYKVAEAYVSIRTERFRYTRYRNDQEEFYDCAKDPREWTNQIANPEYASEIAKLRRSVPQPSEMVTSQSRGKK